MKIGFSTSVIQRGKTGIAQYTFALLEALDRVASNHRFVLFVLEEDLCLFQGLSSRFELVPVPEEFRPPVRNIRWHQVQLPRLCEQHRIEVLHVPSYRRLLWRAPCPKVATIHDLAPFHVSKKYDLARMIYGKFVVKQLARRQEEIIAVSGNTARDIERFFGIPPERLHIIHNGLDHQRFFPRGQEEARAFVQAQYGLGKPFLLYVARLEHPGKNHLRLIEAFEGFKRRSGSDWMLALGGSNWHGAEVIHNRIAASPFRTEIRALGFIDNDHLPLLYSAAELFVYPSLFEGFGMPPVEAMACGVPVVCSDRGSLGEIVAQAARIIAPEDVGSIEGALLSLYSAPEMRKELVARGLERSRYFSWERAALETLAVYQKAFAKGQAKRARGKGRDNLGERLSVPAEELSV